MRGVPPHAKKQFMYYTIFGAQSQPKSSKNLKKTLKNTPRNLQKTTHNPPILA
jgi:hypothetical protein